jgi:cell division protein ZapA
MKSIKVSILDKQYPLRVEESEEETLRNIAGYVDDKIRQYKKELSKQPESTAMVLAALSIAEELFEERQNAIDNSGRDEQTLEEVNESMQAFLKQIRA